MRLTEFKKGIYLDANKVSAVVVGKAPMQQQGRVVGMRTVVTVRCDGHDFIVYALNGEDGRVEAAANEAANRWVNAVFQVLTAGKLTLGFVDDPDPKDYADFDKPRIIQ